MNSPRRFERVAIAILAVILGGGFPPVAPIREVLAAAPVTALAIDSQMENIGLGLQAVYGVGDATFDVTGTSDTVTAHVVPTPGQAWSLTFGAPLGGALLPGSYLDASSIAPSVTDNHPFMLVSSGPLGGCSGPRTGLFTVHEYGQAADGSVTSVSISFEQHCPDSSGALYGELRFQGSAGFPWRAVVGGISDYIGSSLIGAASIPATITVSSIGTDPLTVSAVSLAGPDAADFAIVSETCTAAPVAPAGSCAIVVGVTPSRPGTLAARLVIADDTFSGGQVVFLYAHGTWPDSSVAWSSARTVVPSALPAESSLAWSASSRTSGYLHVVYARPPGSPMGVYYRRSRTGGAWTMPVRLSPATQRGRYPLPVVAASGRMVYVAWLSSSRVLYLRSNASYGTGVWRATRRLTSLTARVGQPSIAATGGSIYIAYTDAKSGSIRLAISHDRGATWRTGTLGCTTRYYGGYDGAPSVATSGSLIIVAWQSSAGTILARLSTTSGLSWDPVVAMPTTGMPSHARAGATPGRAAVAWTSGSGDTYVRVWRSASWAVPRLVGPIGILDGLALSGGAGIAIASESSGTALAKPGVSWTESMDDGITWFGPRAVAIEPPGSPCHNGSAAIVWARQTLRYAMWGLWWDEGFAGAPSSCSGLRLRVGTGSP